MFWKVVERAAARTSKSIEEVEEVEEPCNFKDNS